MIQLRAREYFACLPSALLSRQSFPPAHPRTSKGAPTSIRISVLEHGHANIISSIRFMFYFTAEAPLFLKVSVGFMIWFEMVLINHSTNNDSQVFSRSMKVQTAQQVLRWHVPKWINQYFADLTVTGLYWFGEE